jgi:hypothetical protein
MPTQTAPSPIALLAATLRTRARRWESMRSRFPRASYEAGEARGRAAALADVAVQLESMLEKDP